MSVWWEEKQEQVPAAPRDESFRRAAVVVVNATARLTEQRAVKVPPATSVASKDLLKGHQRWEGGTGRTGH